MFLCVKTVSGKVVRRSLAYLSVHKWLVGDVPFYLKFWTSDLPCSSTAITPSEKSSIITNRESTTGFPMSLRWTNTLRCPKPPKRGSKMQNGRFPYKSWLFSTKVCYKVFCVKTVSGRVVRHSLVYPTVHKWFVGDVPLYVSFMRKDTRCSSRSECHSWCHRAASVATGLLQNTPDLLSKKPQTNSDKEMT